MTQSLNKSSRKVLAVASGGGHWEQMMLLRPVLDQYDVSFATTEADVATQHGITSVDTLPDCNQNQPIKSLLCGFMAARLVIKHRPHIVLSTGAAPGFFCLMAGRLIGAKTLWIDSVANGEQLSMCGKLSKRFAHQCLTQWPELADDKSVKYRGAVL